MKDKKEFEKEFLSDILAQPNTLTPMLIERLEQMIELLSLEILKEFYFALMNDDLGVNKIKNGLISMQYIYHYYKIYIQKQITKSLNEELAKFVNKEALEYGNYEHLKILQSQKYFDESLDVKDYFKDVITKKLSVFINENE